MPDLAQLTLSGVAHRCRQETSRFFNGGSYDPSYCFELFRQALQQGSDFAWEQLYDIFCPLVAAWVKRHPAFPGCGEEVQFFVNRAFERFWASLTAGKFDQQSHLEALLTYLKRCVHSAIIDHLRQSTPAEPSLDEDIFPSMPDPQPPPESQADDRLQSQALWQSLKSRLKNKKERVFVFAYFSLSLKPREILEQYPNVFVEIGEVYRVRENLFERLKRDPEFGALCGEDT